MISLLESLRPEIYSDIQASGRFYFFDIPGFADVRGNLEPRTTVRDLIFQIISDQDKPLKFKL